MVNTFTVFEENSGIQSSKIHQNESLLKDLIVSIFTMIEENFESQSSKVLQSIEFW